MLKKLVILPNKQFLRFLEYYVSTPAVKTEIAPQPYKVAIFLIHWKKWLRIHKNLKR